jgi:hypothetical protein
MGRWGAIAAMPFLAVTGGIALKRRMESNRRYNRWRNLYRSRGWRG